MPGSLAERDARPVRVRTVELFAGAGGSALGLERAGLDHIALCETDRSACETLRLAGFDHVVESDVRDLDAIGDLVGDRCDLIWSSFPCQAWSRGGVRRGAADDRNGWPWTVDAIDRLRPRWFLGENVRGLAMHRNGCTTRGGQRSLFGEAPEQSCPGCYLERVILGDLRRRFPFAGWWMLDAADYGVPQFRKRVILWAGDRPLRRPEPTHGPGRARPWRSTRVALGIRAAKRDNNDPAPVDERREIDLTDRPAPTVSAGYRGVRGGEIYAIERGEARPLTVREMATLQGFPPDYQIAGSRWVQYRQVGNAVPPILAEVVGRSLLAAAGDERPPLSTEGDTEERWEI